MVNGEPAVIWLSLCLPISSLQRCGECSVLVATTCLLMLFGCWLPGDVGVACCLLETAVIPIQVASHQPWPSDCCSFNGQCPGPWQCDCCCAVPQCSHSSRSTPGLVFADWARACTRTWRLHRLLMHRLALSVLKDAVICGKLESTVQPPANID